MRPLRTFVIAVMLLLPVACANQSSPSDGGTGDGAPSGACLAPNVLRFEKAGCDQPAICGSLSQHACLQLRCSCRGRIVSGCDYYPEPWVDGVFSLGTFNEGDPCSVDGGALDGGSSDAQ